MKLTELQKEARLTKYRAELEAKRRRPRGIEDTPAGPVLIVGKPVRR